MISRANVIARARDVCVYSVQIQVCKYVACVYIKSVAICRATRRIHDVEHEYLNSCHRCQI